MTVETVNRRNRSAAETLRSSLQSLAAALIVLLFMTAFAHANAPAFSVHKNGTDQTITASTNTALTWSTEVFDTNNNFASDRFTPTVAGKYLIVVSARCAQAGTCVPSIYKNGALYAQTQWSNRTFADQSPQATAIIDMNGTSDYVEAFIFSTGNVIGGTSDRTYFSGSQIDGAGSGGGGGGGAVVLSSKSSAPATCSAANDGTIELTGDYTLCVCRSGTGWVSTSNGTTACVWNTRTIVANGSSRNWSDGTYAASCNGYRNPDAGFVYSGSTGDGMYTINPTGSPFDAYCDMTTNSGGWTLIADGGSSCSSVDPKTALNLSGSCGYLAQGTVSSLAGISTEVQLRSGASHSSFSAVNSTDALARSALQSPTGTWHNGASGTFNGWSWSLSCGSIANGWPNMFHACGNPSGVHWLLSIKFSRTASAEARSSTWLK